MTEKKRVMLIAAIASVALALGALVAWIIWSNVIPELNTYTVTGERLPQSFDGCRIAHVSDLHNAQMGENNEKLLGLLREAQPDIIAITGDLIDSRNTDMKAALRFVEEAMKIAPCYYVTGNHEARIGAYGQFKKDLAELGVVVLEDERLELERSGESIILLGVDDPSFQTDYLSGDSAAVMEGKLQKLVKREDPYTVLLSHRPELFEIYAENGIDLVLSGHAHGGQFQLPFVGGLFAPNQGFFPEYDAGLYTKGCSAMIVSRGIGNSAFPFRFNNPPEVILIELRAA